MDKELRKGIGELITQCYSKEGCKLHPVFQPQKFLNKLIPYLDSKDGVFPEYDDEERTKIARSNAIGMGLIDD